MEYLGKTGRKATTEMFWGPVAGAKAWTAGDNK